jgi:AbiJ N-terminal domain 4
MALFSQRQGYVRPKEIVYRDELPRRTPAAHHRYPAALIQRAFLWERIEALFNPYGIDDWPPPGEPITILKEEDHPTFVAAQRILLRCEWFRLYDLIEDLYSQLDFHDIELRNEDEDFQSYPFQQSLNEYFEYAGIGWQLVGGNVIMRGDEPFQRTVQIAPDDLKAGGRITATERIDSAIRSLSLRPKPDFSAAVERATNAMECVLHDITGANKHMTLGDYLSQRPDLFPGHLRKTIEGVWAYACNSGARHGKENVEPPREEAEFIVGIAAAFTTYLNRKYPRP